MTGKPHYRTGDPCPNCLSDSAYVFLGQSNPLPKIGMRVRRYYCSEKCGWVQKEMVPLEDAPRRRATRWGVRIRIANEQNEP